MPPAAASVSAKSRENKKKRTQKEDDTLFDEEGDAEGDLGSSMASKLQLARRVGALASRSDSREDKSEDSSTQAKTRRDDADTKLTLDRSKGIFMFKDITKHYYDHQVTQIFIAGLILANFFVNVIEKQIDPSGTVHEAFFKSAEDFFNWIFLGELLWNLYSNFFMAFICSGWNIFDSIVVSVGILSLARVPLCCGLSLLRCLRALRVFRLFKRIKSLLKILTSIMNAVPGVMNAFVVVMIVISIYSILAVEFFFNFDQHPVTIGNVTQVECYYYNYQRPMVNGELERVYSVTARGLCFSEEYYGSFFRAWFSLFQILTGDSWSEVLARPIIFGWDQFVLPPTQEELDASSEVDVFVNNQVSNYIAGFFFMTFVLINSFVLINVVVAVLLDKMVSADDDMNGEEEEEDHEGPVTASAVLKLESEQRALGRKVEAMTDALQAIGKSLGVPAAG